MSLLKKLTVILLGACSLGMQAQNGPRNTDKNFPEAQPTNKSVEMVTQTDTLPRMTYLKDVVYATKDGTDLKLQIIQPDKKGSMAKGYPCIVFVKGSAWMEQKLYADIPALSVFARRGYVVAIVEYRHSGLATFPAQRNDALSAIAFMRKNADKYGIDANNMFVWGTSSGAHTALFTGLHIGNDTLPAINGIIAYYPPTDVLRLKDDPTAASKGDALSPEGRLIGNVAVYDAPEKAKEASPYYYIDSNRNMPPVFLAHGTMDRVVPFSQSDMLANKLEENGIEYEFYALRRADHGSWEFWTDEMFDKVDAFIKKHLKH